MDPLEVEKSERCPYRDVCPVPCPGDALGRGEWESSLGFKEVEEGILCLDWDIVIPHLRLKEVKKREPRLPTTYDPNAEERIAAARRKYSRSEARKATQNRYEATEKGRATLHRHQQSEKWKLTQQKYYFSEKGQLAHKRQSDLNKEIRIAARWLKENPDKTMKDYLEEHPDV